MHRKSFFSRTLGLAAAFAAITLCSLNARAELVFGNLPATGMVVSSDSPTDYFPTPQSSLAHGFTSGPMNLTVESIILGMSGAFATDIGSHTVAMHSNGGHAPRGLLLQPNAIHDREQNKPFFDSNAFFLSPNTRSWGVSEQASSRHLTIDKPQPAGLIGSDYVTDGTDRQENSDLGTQVIAAQPSSVSLEAIPQRSSPVMAGLGVGGIALLARRQRRKA